MPNWSRIAALTAALIVAAAVTTVTPADAAKAMRKPVSKTESNKKPPRERTEKHHDYSARAHAADPSGDFKGYPDWARAAIGPKLDY